MTSPFEFINSICFDKKNLLEEDAEEKEYDPFIINRGLSLFADTILYANEMNIYHTLPKVMQYDFLLNCVSKRKRFSKWPKKLKSEDIDLIAKHFDYNKERAAEALQILTEDQVNELRERYSSLEDGTIPRGRHSKKR